MLVPGVLTAVDAVVNHLKAMSRKVTTPEEIAQVSQSANLSNLETFIARERTDLGTDSELVPICLDQDRSSERLVTLLFVSSNATTAHSHRQQKAVISLSCSVMCSAMVT